MERLVALCLAVLYFMTPMMAEKKKVTLRIIETSDVHGCFFPYDFIDRKPMKGSLARVSTYVNKLCAEYGDNVILIDNGDILQGQPLCYYYNYIGTKMPNIAASVVNYMKYDACTIGNHDIETGHHVYDKWIGELKCPVIAANVISTSTNKPYTSPYTIIVRNNVKIAILGMLTPAIPNWLNQNLWTGMRFENITESAKHWIDYLKREESPDLIIGLFHSGWNGGISTVHYNEDETKKVASDIPGFDIIFFGHDHTVRKEMVTGKDGKETLCLNPSCNALYIGDACVEIEIEKNKVVGKTITGQVHDISEIPVDQTFTKHFENETEIVKTYVERRVGRLEEDLNTKDCFFGSAPFTDFIHNLQLSITGADISFNAPLSFNTQIKQGDIYVSDMFKLYRYENQIYVLYMTGTEIRNYLEMSYDLWVNTMRSPDDHIMRLNSNNNGDMQRYGFQNLTFNFDSAAGIDYEVDVTKPKGCKIKVLRLSDGRAFKESEQYKVVMNSYRGNGGGELLTKGAGIPKDSLQSRIIYQSDKDQRYYLMKEIEKISPACPKANNNWHFVPTEWTERALERDRKLIFGE